LCHARLYIQTRDPSVLEAAITNFKAAAEHQLDKRERRGVIKELSGMLARKYDVTRVIFDLQEAIRWARIAVEENPICPLTLQNAAGLIYRMCEDVNDTGALDESIKYFEATWTLYKRKPGKYMATFYYRFANALIRRSDEAGTHEQLQDIEHAIDLLKLAVDNASPQQVDLYQYRLKDAIIRQDRIYANRTASPPPTPFHLGG
jgi:hypothetical protein